MVSIHNRRVSGVAGRLPGVVMDVPKVQARFASFIDMTTLEKVARRSSAGNGTYAATKTRAQAQDIRAEAQVIEQLLDAVLPRWRSLEAVDTTLKWQQHRRACIRAVSELEHRDEVAAMLGDTSPTLSASGLHRWVWAGARSLWGSGHYAEAVSAAARQVNAETQTKVGRRDASESDLMLQCFSDDPAAVGKPRLRLPGDDGGKSALSLRRGVRFYAQGCYAALRNPAAHDVTPELSEHEALEQLAAFSILARWVEAATLETTP